MSDDDQQIVCATYTHARRHPMVIGQIGGWTPPFQLSFPQVGVLVAVLFIEYQTWGLWLGHLPPALAILLAVAIPGVSAWVARRARFEGRSLPRAAVGWMGLLLTPAGGRAGGRSHRSGRVTSCSAWVFVAPGATGPWALPSGPGTAGALPPRTASPPERGGQR